MFTTEIKVRFNHIDAAGIVFYPRYYEMFNQVVEEWFEEKIGCDFHDLDVKFGAGVPAAKIDVEFPKPSRLGDILNFSLVVNKVGHSSINLTIEAHVNQKKCVKAAMVLVYVHRQKPGHFAPDKIPDSLRQSMLAT